MDGEEKEDVQWELKDEELLLDDLRAINSPRKSFIDSQTETVTNHPSPIVYWLHNMIIIVNFLHQDGPSAAAAASHSLTAHGALLNPQLIK